MQDKPATIRYRAELLRLYRELSNTHDRAESLSKGETLAELRQRIVEVKGSLAACVRADEVLAAALCPQTDA